MSYRERDMSRASIEAISMESNMITVFTAISRTARNYFVHTPRNFNSRSSQQTNAAREPINDDASQQRYINDLQKSMYMFFWFYTCLRNYSKKTSINVFNFYSSVLYYRLKTLVIVNL